MHTADTAKETLEFLWHNHLTLSESVDLSAMPHEDFEAHVENGSPVRPFRIATWLARYGCFNSAWTLWEFYSRSLCERLPCKEKRQNRESTVDWIARSLASNSVGFTDHQWFASANCLRNLIAHSGGRASEPSAQRLLSRAIGAFPDLHAWQDGYVDLKHEHVADLKWRIGEFIDSTTPTKK